MLMYGTSDVIHFLNEDTIIFNYASYSEGFNQIYLLPQNNISYLHGMDFDIAYYNYVLGNDTTFCNLMNIVMPLYMGKDVFLMFSEGFDWIDNCIESLLKIIQQRYGYNSVKITEFQDFIYASNHMLFSFNPDWGLANLDEDKERFALLSEKIRIKNGGKPYEVDD